MLNNKLFNYTSDVIDKIRRGYYSAIYFSRTKDILEKDGNRKSATMQIFQRHEAVLCGIEEVVELLKIGSGYWERGKWIDAFPSIHIQALTDGDEIQPSETVMHIEGPYHIFAHLESIYLGILARRTKIATNVRKAVDAARGKPVVFFADRFDHFLNQEGDGYAAKVGGATGVATPAQAAWWGGEASGTMPHSLIALYNGDTITATEKYREYNPGVNLIALVDFHNDVVGDSLGVAKHFGKKLWGIRIDTSFDMMDKSLESSKFNPPVGGQSSKLLQGVNPSLVKLLRKALDHEGFSYVKIVASGGFDAEKIARFEKEQTPVDLYGVGSALLKGECDFTADIVKVEGKEIAKEGRIYRPNSRLKTV